MWRERKRSCAAQTCSAVYRLLHTGMRERSRITCFGVARSAHAALAQRWRPRAQRGSVIVSDAVLVAGAWFATRREREPQRSVLVFLLVANAGLLIVDHIHFQYNGLLLGAQRPRRPCLV